MKESIEKGQQDYEDGNVMSPKEAKLLLEEKDGILRMKLKVLSTGNGFATFEAISKLLMQLLLLAGLEGKKEHFLYF